jgi:hypothetical protein
MTDERMSRRRMIAYSVGAGAGLYVLGSMVDRSVAPPYPQLVLPSGLPALMVQRLQNLHSRYSALRVSGGVPAVRQRVLADLHGYRGYDQWLEAVVNWIRFGGWADTADLLIDAAEIGGDTVRRNAAVLLATTSTPLVTGALHGPRVVRLHKQETDAAAVADWKDLRRKLGV